MLNGINLFQVLGGN